MEADTAEGGVMTQNSVQYFHPVAVFQVQHTSEVLCNRKQDLVETVLPMEYG
jgi:hypothetical protein